MPTKPDGTPDFAQIEDLLPEGAVPLQSWRIVKFMDSEGEERFNWDCEGGPRISDTAGMVEVVKFDALHRLAVFCHGEEEEEDAD